MQAVARYRSIVRAGQVRRSRKAAGHRLVAIAAIAPLTIRNEKREQAQDAGLGRHLNERVVRLLPSLFPSGRVVVLELSCPTPVNGWSRNASMPSCITIRRVSREPVNSCLSFWSSAMLAIRCQIDVGMNRIADQHRRQVHRSESGRTVRPSAAAIRT